MTGTAFGKRVSAHAPRGDGTSALHRVPRRPVSARHGEAAGRGLRPLSREDSPSRWTCRRRNASRVTRAEIGEVSEKVNFPHEKHIATGLDCGHCHSGRRAETPPRLRPLARRPAEARPRVLRHLPRRRRARSRRRPAGWSRLHEVPCRVLADTERPMIAELQQRFQRLRTVLHKGKRQNEQPITQGTRRRQSDSGWSSSSLVAAVSVVLSLLPPELKRPTCQRAAAVADRESARRGQVRRCQRLRRVP